MKNFKKGLLITFICVLSATSCKKDNPNQTVSLNSKTKAGPNYYFNWETASYMPTNPNSQNSNVYMPWQSQVGTPIPSSIASDYKSSDGWQLVYNTFNPGVYPTKDQQPSGGLYFALYNVYRGLLRFYLYIPPGYVNNNNDVEHGLSLYTNGQTTTMLNFEGGDIVDPSTYTSTFAKTNNSGISSSGGWYAMQYQIAYDPNFQTTTYPNLGFNWYSRSVSISQIVLNGTSTGTITGNITQKSSGFNWKGVLTNAALATGELLTAGDLGAASADATNFNSAAQGGLAGNITGFLDAIFGGNSSNTQEVDLKINSTVAMNGTVTSNQLVAPNSLVVPGQTTANNVGAPSPLYPAPLGVFNFPNKPVVHITRTQTTAPSSWDGPSNQYYVNTFTIDPNFVNSIQRNPAVLNGVANVPPATVSVQSTQVLLENFDAASSFYNYTQVNEQVGNISLIDNTTIDGRIINPADATALVRVVVLVTPNNSTTPPIRIVKTFLATLTTP